MSGCDLLLYQRNGAVHAGHLGTTSDADAQNALVKAKWNGFATNAGQAHIIGGFNPLRDWVGAYPVRQGNDIVGPPLFFGLYTTAHTFYTLVLFSQKVSGGAHPTLKRVAALQQINSKSYHQLCHL
jgi:hypothetical protein